MKHWLLIQGKTIKISSIYEIGASGTHEQSPCFVFYYGSNREMWIDPTDKTPILCVANLKEIHTDLVNLVTSYAINLQSPKYKHLKLI